MLAIVCPGQGSQTPGFLTPWLDLPGATDTVAWLSACTGLGLAHLGTAADADTIKDTANAQPLIVAAGLLALGELFDHPADLPRHVDVTAGHSVGELTAAALTGALSTEQALVVVRERANAMADAAHATPTGMSAVVGGDPEDVLTRLESLDLTPANMNGSGQVVAAGSLSALEALKADPPTKARVIPLAVAGAFHTPFMASAQERLDAVVRGMTPHDARLPLVSNKDGHVVHAGDAIVARLVSQVTSPVRWDLTMATLVDMGVTGVIELPPAGTLVGLMKRGMPGVETLALKSPDDLDAARRMVREHGEGQERFDPAWRLVVAPAKGTITRAELSDGDIVTAGDAIGQIVTARDTYPVIAPHGGRVIEWLVEQDDPVAPGQPLVRLHPEEA